MMGLPLPISMIFPKIQEEFKKLIDSGEVAGLVVTIEKNGVSFIHDTFEVFITPEMEYDDIIKRVEAIKDTFNNGK